MRNCSDMSGAPSMAFRSSMRAMKARHESDLRAACHQHLAPFKRCFWLRMLWLGNWCSVHQSSSAKRPKLELSCDRTTCHTSIYLYRSGFRTGLFSMTTLGISRASRTASRWTSSPPSHCSPSHLIVELYHHMS